MAGAIGVSSSFVGGDGRPLLEPGALFVDGNYALRLNAWCSVAGVTLALRSRFLRSHDGELVDSGDTLAVTGNRVITTTDVQLGAGFPLNAEVFALAGTPTIGQCFAQVQIVRGRGPAAVPLATVLQGYVSATQALSWPGSPIVDSLSGAGALRSIAIAQPAPGAEVTQLVPAGARWQVISLIGQLNTSAAAANRFPSAFLSDGAQRYVEAITNVILAASLSGAYCWMSGFGGVVTQATTPARTTAGLPNPSLMLANFQLGTLTGNIQAADQWVNAECVVREWLDV